MTYIFLMITRIPNKDIYKISKSYSQNSKNNLQGT